MVLTGGQSDQAAKPTAGTPSITPAEGGSMDLASYGSFDLDFVRSAPMTTCYEMLINPRSCPQTPLPTGTSTRFSQAGTTPTERLT